MKHGADLGLLRAILPLAIVPAPCCLPSLLSFLRSGLNISYTPRVPTRVGSDLAAHLLPGGLFFSSCFSREGRSETVECGLDPIDPAARSLEIFLNVCHPEAARPDWMTSSPYFGHTDTEALSNPAGACLSLHSGIPGVTKLGLAMAKLERGRALPPLFTQRPLRTIPSSLGLPFPLSLFFPTFPSSSPFSFPLLSSFKFLHSSYLPSGLGSQCWLRHAKASGICTAPFRNPRERI